MGATIYPAGITEDQEEAFLSEGSQVVGHFTYGTIFRCLGVAGVAIDPDVDYMGSFTPTAELVAEMATVATRNPEDRAFGVFANTLRAARLMGVDVLWD